MDKTHEKFEFRFKEETGSWFGQWKEIKNISSDMRKKVRSIEISPAYFGEGRTRLGEDFSREAFDGMEHLEELIMKDCAIKTLPENAFSGFRKLEHLALEQNLLEELPPLIFNDLASLKRVSLFMNKLVELPPKLLANCPNLDWINFGSNHLKEIPTGFLDGCTLLDANVGMSKGGWTATPNFGDQAFQIEEPIQLSPRIKLLALDTFYTYSLFAIKDGDAKYMSSCRRFKDANEALLHWDKVIVRKSFTGEKLDFRRTERARIFADAIRRFEQENQS